MSTATKTPPPKPDHQDWPDWQEDAYARADRRMTVSVGIAVTILFHLGIVLMIPWNSFLTVEPRAVEKTQPLELEFVEFEMPKFVETNPNVTPDRPEETNNIAAQDQVAAQEDPDPNDNSDKPRVEGEQLESPKIVDGAMADPTPPPMPEGQQTPEQEAQPMVEPTPPQPEPVEAVEPETNIPETPEPQQQMQEAAPEALEQEPIEEEGELSMEEPAEAEKIPEEPVEEPQEEPEQPKPQPKEIPKIMMEEVAPQQQSTSGEPSPQARPRINFRVPAGPKMQQGHSANRMGQVAIDANFSEFGAYQQRMVEAISAQWYLLGNQARYTGADVGTNCVVEFVLDREGKVSDVRVLHSSSSSAGTLMTMEAIKSRAPYGPWTQDMIKVLGEQQSIRINFFYR